MIAHETHERKDLPARLAHNLARAAGAPARGYSPAMSYGRHHGPPRPDARLAAVLIVLYRDADQWWIPLTLRPQHLSAHGGQVCLPGGSVEAGESTRAAARREFQEELGIWVREQQMIGLLHPLYVFNSNFLVYPWVAWSDAPLRWTIQPAEVAEVTPLPVSELLTPANTAPYQIKRGLFSFTAPAFQLGPHRVWGATRVILANLADCIRAC